MSKALSFALVMSLALLDSKTTQEDVQLASISSYKGRLYVTPIAIIRSGKLLRPPWSHKTSESVIGRFIHLHYATGTSMSAWQSGEALGRVRVGEMDPGCDSDYNFNATPIGAIDIDKSRGALATSRNITPTHPDYRRPATDEERAEFGRQSESILSKSNPTITPKTRLKIHALTSTKIAGEGDSLLVGSISFIQPDNEYWLFVILEQHVGAWAPAISETHRIRDLEDRTDAQEEKYLDQLDIDGDGMDEIFTESTYYEASSFTAYGIRNGIWRKIYASGVGGC